MAKAYVSKEVFFDMIDKRFVVGMSCEKIAGLLEMDTMTVRTNCAVFENMREQKFDDIVKMIGDSNKVSKKAIIWSAQKLGIEIPYVVEKAFEEKAAERKQQYIERKARNEEPVEEPVVEEPENKPEKKQPGTQNEGFFFIKILEAMHEQNELLRQLMDAVIPHFVSDMKDNMNTNTDVICERLKHCETSLDKIACNTRKRGL